MYTFFNKFMPPVAASLFTAIWYAVLVVSIYALSIGPEGDFGYFRI